MESSTITKRIRQRKRQVEKREKDAVPMREDVDARAPDEVKRLVWSLLDPIPAMSGSELAVLRTEIARLLGLKESWSGERSVYSPISQQIIADIVGRPRQFVSDVERLDMDVPETWRIVLTLLYRLAQQDASERKEAQQDT